MLIPLRTLPILRIDWKKKLIVTALFALGIFAIFTAVTRLVLILKDATTIQIMTWSGIEQAVCYICANAPALRPLFFRDAFTRSSADHSWPSNHDTYHEMAPNDSKASSGRTHATGDSFAEVTATEDSIQ
jgi:hypothetical protein